MTEDFQILAAHEAYLEVSTSENGVVTIGVNAPYPALSTPLSEEAEAQLLGFLKAREKAKNAGSEKLVLMPESLTAENGAKAALIGEFHERLTIECHECRADPEEMDECETCGGTGDITERIPVEWTTIKEIYKRAVALLGRAA